MDLLSEPLVDILVADTTAFIQESQLQNYGKKVVTVQDVVNEVTSKRQLRKLAVLPYDLEIKEVFPESIKFITDFAKKTGDYLSLSATDIKVMALTYQLEKEEVGTDHLHTEPVAKKQVNVITDNKDKPDMDEGLVGFYMPGKKNRNPSSRSTSRTTSLSSNISKTEENLDEDDVIVEENEIVEKFGKLDCNDINNVVIEEERKLMDDILEAVKENSEILEGSEDEEELEEEEDDDGEGWITPKNVHAAKKRMGSRFVEEKHVKVACMTTDFAMQNVLKQINLNVAALNGRLITQLRTFIFRCYTCFKTTSIMTKQFCPSCGNHTLKKVAVSVDENGKQVIHINGRKPLTGRGKIFSVPKFQGGKHACNPIVVADQPLPDNKPSRMARTKTNVMDNGYVEGYSPFAMRDITSKSAVLGIRPNEGYKHWMQKNPNEARKRRK